MSGDILTYCRTPDELHAWIKTHLGLSIPRQSVCPHHQPPFDYLWKSYHEPAGDLVVWAPRGGGKTTLGAIATLLDLLHKPTCQVRILGGSLEQSLRLWEHLSPMLQDLAQDMIEKGGRSRRVTLKNGSSAAVLTQSQRNVRGQRVQKLRCDEVEMFDPAVWEAAQLVTRSRTIQDAARLLIDPQQTLVPINASIEALSTLHRPYGMMQKVIDATRLRGGSIIQWCLLDILEQCTDDRQCDQCALYPDCGGQARNARDGYIRIDDAIAMKQRVSCDTWEAEMLCLRPSRADSVFPTFAPQRHVGEQTWWPDINARELKRTLAIDFGFHDPFICLWIVHDWLGRMFVMDEYQATGAIVNSHIQAITTRGHAGFIRVACDPAGKQRNSQTAQTDIDLLQNAGFVVQAQTSRIIDGLSMIRAALDPAAGDLRLRIHPRCINTIRCMECYHYDTDHSENPLKDHVNDHHIDALRYFFHNANHSTTKSGII